MFCHLLLNFCAISTALLIFTIDALRGTDPHCAAFFASKSQPFNFTSPPCNEACIQRLSAEDVCDDRCYSTLRGCSRTCYTVRQLNGKKPCLTVCLKTYNACRSRCAKDGPKRLCCQKTCHEIFRKTRNKCFFDCKDYDHNCNGKCLVKEWACRDKCPKNNYQCESRCYSGWQSCFQLCRVQQRQLIAECNTRCFDMPTPCIQECRGLE